LSYQLTNQANAGSIRVNHQALTSSIKKAKGIKIIVAFSHLLKPTANENIKPTKKKIKAMPNK
jgi:hypothetical protein